MNSLKPILAAILLTLTISISALAGDVSTPTYNNNPPPPATCSSCDEQPPTTLTEPTEPGSSSELAVEILLALLTIF